ncbi:MAG: tRNA pseudouridine(55) synthase TruB [Lachnospiraceae bacterium]|nr:tRNA pseudouridine(55) synthase TruB [Lachnospiraceae bacterium]MCI9478384.1 tRNA pseudouridine(55) synthase TruB [Lachnospiraceae bacterium]GFI09836.1 tRNA pseudouridine synthase B [Lachnospiraceae bacterium]
MNGILNIYKEAGFTSHDVVAKLRGILKQKKIGHTGTLDPDAEGVLPVCVGNATKLCGLLTEKEKTYEAVLLLGQETDTQDISGKILRTEEVKVSPEAVREAVESFQGSYDQVPPMYSALKIKGKKLYELAREGKVVERKARTVFLREISISRMELPEVSFAVTCSSGTYIRTLCHDIGQKLGCGGCMKSLLRTRVERFVIRDSLRLSQIEEKMAEGRIGDCLIPVDRMFGQYPKVQMKETGDRLVYNGNAFFLRDVASDAIGAAGAEGEAQVRVYDSKGSFVGIYRYEQEVFRPVKMFL